MNEERMSQILKPVWKALHEAYPDLQGFSLSRSIERTDEGWRTTDKHDLSINGGSVGFGMSVKLGETADLAYEKA